MALLYSWNGFLSSSSSRSVHPSARGSSCRSCRVVVRFAAPLHSECVEVRELEENQTKVENAKRERSSIRTDGQLLLARLGQTKGEESRTVSLEFVALRSFFLSNYEPVPSGSLWSVCVVVRSAARADGVKFVKNSEKS